VRAQAGRQPDRRVYTFLEEGETESGSLTYRQLDDRARRIGAALQARAAEGEPVLLLYPPGIDLIAAFCGCLYGGAIAVPSYPPQGKQALARLQVVAADARPELVLTTSDLLGPGKALLSAIPALANAGWLATDDLPGELAERWVPGRTDADSIAFLQYTSGSTAEPKGVMVSQGNLVHNEEMIRTAFGVSPESVIVGWLPPYHDMGLVGNLLQPLYSGARCIFMSPAAFVQSPRRWLAAVSRHRGTISGGPNFAYELAARRIGAGERRELDLSCWKVAFCGAEPVQEATLRRFADAFAPSGFAAEAFYPCYGLAEATLFVSGGQRGRPVAVASLAPEALESHRVAEPAAPGAPVRRLVGCGQAWLGQQVRIVDPESRLPCAPDRVGEIWVAGPSVAKGYYRRQDATEETFRARLADGSAGVYLRTGDLGFFKDGELLIAGRLKDLIILRGRNLHPQDLEATAGESHPAIRPGCGAAFSLEIAGEERLVVAFELHRDRETEAEDAAAAIRRAIAEQHEAQVQEVVLLRAGGVPKTLSGKIQRHLCRRRYLAGELPVVGRSALAEPAAEEVGALSREGLLALAAELRAEVLEAHLRQRIGRAARAAASDLDRRRPLLDLGLDSLAALDLQHELGGSLGAEVSLKDLLGGITLAALVEQVLAQVERSEALRLVPVSATATRAEGDHPLSFGQRAIWFLQALAPESAAYNLAGAARIRGALDRRALRRAWELLAARHAALRTTFVAAEGSPVQRVHETLEVGFSEVDASAWSAEQLGESLHLEAYRVFDLASGPLLRLAVFHRSSQEHAVCLAVHHAVCDLWSLGVLLRELGALYSQEAGEGPAQLAPLAVRYSDYVRWQHEQMGGEAGARLWEYWRRRLAGELPSLDLPTDRPRPAVQTYRGSAVRLGLDRELTLALGDLSRSSGATLFMTLLTGYLGLLHRHTGQRDLLVGSPSSGRSRAEFEGVVGFFVNPLVLRVDLSGQPSFGEALARVRATALEAFEHQDYPFELLAERLQLVRDPSRPPLYQVMFVFQKAQKSFEEGLVAFAVGEPGVPLKLGALRLESLAIEERKSQSELILMVGELDGRLAAFLQYNSDLFDRSTVDRLLRQLRVLLQQGVRGPRRPISDLPLVAGPERQQLALEWNDTAAALPGAATLHRLVEERAAEHPERVAVAWGEERTSFGELNRWANGVARSLARRGVGPEVRVGLCLPRSTDLVVGALSILKAGGAYVPLDPAYPAGRIGYMLADARVPAVVSRDKLRSLWGEAGREAACVEVAGAAPAAENAGVPVAGQNLAYVLYTSGSTGRPKGVALTHGGAVNLVGWARVVFRQQDLEGMVASTSICFDVSVFEFFGALGWGGRVLLTEDPLALASEPWAAEGRLIATVPSATAELARLGLPPTLGKFFLGGEPVPNRLVQRLYEEPGVVEVLDGYGPSEDTTYTTSGIVARGWQSSPPIGRPASNKRLAIASRGLREAPVGVVGELCIGGAGLARGYLDRPALTAEKFVPDPFGGEAGGRLYRTGDVARWLSDGRVDLLGRMDHQVKIRGFRVELGEIEATLAAHPQVLEGVVVARAGAGGDRRLVAYAVARDGVVPSAAELRAHLAESLPEYMVPQAFVVLEALPLLPNGKVDRRGLPEPEWDRLARAKGFEAPRTELEEELAAIWAEVLQVERVGIHDDFFELGGHSLLATRALGRIRGQLGVDLALRVLFTAPTVAEVADYIETLRWAAEGGQAPTPGDLGSRSEEIEL
jgi:amino acid adenylation domain-containing protein